MLRKIKTQAEVEKGKRRNHIFVGVIMIGLLVVSTLGYSLISSDQDENSKTIEFGVEFFKEDGLWMADFDGEIFGFQNLPSEVSDVDVNVSFDLGRYSGQPLYFVNPNEGALEFLNNVGRYVLRYQESCLQQDSGIRDSSIGVRDLGLGIRGNNELGNLSDEGKYICDGDLPVKNCESNLVIFEVGNKTAVYQNESCIFIVGDGVKGVDAFLYEVLGVI